MARSIKSKKLDSRTARRAIAAGKVTHWLPVSRGRALGYRKGLNGGSWIARFDAEYFRREKKLAEADDVLDSDGVQILDYAQALEKANEFFLTAVSRATGKATRTGAFTVADAIAFYLKSLERNGKRDFLHAGYDFNAHVIPKLGDIPMERLAGERLEEWRDQIVNNPKRSTKKIKEGDTAAAPLPMTDERLRQRRSTANRIVRRLLAALNYAWKKKKVNANPLNWRIEPFEDVDKGRANFLTESDQKAFIKACAPEKDFQELVLAALHSGCRYSELGRLRVKDFVSSGPTIYVEKSKSGKARHVFLDSDGEEFFKRLNANRSADETMLLRSDGSAWGKDHVKKPMRRALTIADMKGIQFHGLRHSFATRLLTSPRGSTEVARKALGHTSSRMIEKHYGHLTDDHMKEVMAELPSAGLNQAAKAKRGNVLPIPSRKRSA